jgi:hypothetical protein
MRSRLLAALVLVATAASPALAEVKTHPTAKIELDVPSGWKMKGAGDLMTIADPTEEVGFILVVADTKDMDKVVANLDQQLAKVATDIKWASPKPEKTTLNGMPALTNRGEGKVNGKGANLGLILVRTPADKALLVVAAVESSKYAGHKAAVQKLIGSIKPVK